MFINVKMQTIIVIVTYISIMKTTIVRPVEARKVCTFHQSQLLRAVETSSSIELSMKKVFLNSGPDIVIIYS